ncbi:endonuclease domain-containing protein [Demequina sp. TTPB684]|uniref:endonuclease domain-containing protein n=1 Tax=unclassified Demequina TaxID=2620311 RepID=UPI001CF42828|nr:MULTISPECIES: endonuclease domain-containing protein [unclassified Demequina]MCB2412258.1 endonuclease domain-containing protein [Demequina sp. TTPB684]UPU87104.1 endonuclease domain-containing protein [Demequina sp. TMPB413]
MTPPRALPNPAPHQTLADWFPSTSLAYRGEQLEAAFSHRQLVLALDSGAAVRLAPGVYASGAHAQSAATRIDAASEWAGSEAWIGGAAALFLAGAMADPPSAIEVVVPAARRMSGRPPWIRIRRLTYRPPTLRVDQWNAVDPGVAWCHAFAEMPHDDRVSALCALVSAQPQAIETVFSAARSLPRLRGRRRMLEVAEHVAAGAESFLEVHALQQVFVGRLFRGLLRQHTVTVEGSRYRLDLYDPTSMTAIETDGARFHASARDWQRDIRRDADLATLGILTLRFSYWDLIERPDWCRERAHEVMARRRRQASQQRGRHTRAPRTNFGTD